ncbi:MAG: hypothetical protein OEZ54_00645 [Gemmatimonadota bacterium]|nr:hypothetical protein [Gemmatimonadota bacterium]
MTQKNARDGSDKTDALSFVVGAEAKRILAAEQLEPDPQLVAEGWERRFVADGGRATEAIELYEELGYEVLSVPVKADEVGDDCDECQLVAFMRFSTIYTRKKGATRGNDG